MSSGSPENAPDPATFRKVLSNNVPVGLANSPHRFAGELDSIRFVTILFADIVGSTHLIRELDPEDGRDLIDSAITLIRQAIHEFDGLVVRVQGDGVMAVFGVHPAARDHALCAALAARRIVEQMGGNTLNGLPALKARVGIHAGPILLRRQDHDFGSIVDVVGHAAHVAGQIEALSPPGSVAISGATASLISEQCDLRQIGSLSQAGDEVGEAVFELAAVNLHGHDYVPVKGNTTYPVVGRDDDLAQVRAMIATLADRQPAAIGFIGDAGMGKSRLLLEASRIAASNGVTFVVIRGNALIAAVPFGCLTPVVRHMIDLLRQFCPDIAYTAELSSDQIECFNGLVESSNTWLPNFTPSDRSRIATDTIVRIIGLAVAYFPLLILIDDMHYIDKETRLVLSGIRQGTAVGMIAAGRPEAMLRITTLCGKPVRLGALTRDAAQTLVSLINHAMPLEDATVQKILSRADGMPLALQEFAVSALTEYAGNRLPARLENLLAERLAALDEDASRLGQLCAALGPAFPAPLLEKGAALVCRNPAAAAARLVESRVIETAQADIVRFTHQLVQEAAYATMAKRRRAAMHMRVLELLEGEASSYAELATHAEKAGLPERALNYLWSACEEALGLAAVGSTLALYRRARGVAAKLDPASARVQQARFSLLALDTLLQLGLEEEAREDIHAIAGGEINLGSALRTVARLNMALLERMAGAPERGAIWLAEAEADLDRRDSLRQRTYADAVGAYIANSRARPDEAIMRIKRLGQRLDDQQRSENYGALVMVPRILSRAFGAWYSVDLGEISQARAWLAEAFRLSRRYRHNYSRLLASLSRGYLHYRTGRIDKALACLRLAHADCLENRFYTFEPLCAGWIALCLLTQNDLEQAATILREAEDRGYYRQVRTVSTYYFHEARTRLAIARGDAVQAGAMATEALEHCRNCGEIMHELHALVLQAEVRAAFAQPAGPLEDLRLKIASLGIVPLMARLDALGA